MNNLKTYQVFIKRVFDIVLSVLMIILFSPIFLLLYFLIPITSKGPAIYKQERMGMSFCPFMIYKFRSMDIDAETNTGPVLALENDPRITGLGRVIRAVHLDELPQLFNVLKGEMSIVGPRPERPFFVEQFLVEHHGYKYRFSVKPGITGLAQIFGKYNSTAKEKLMFDLMYVQTYSLLLDITILFRTIYVLFQKDKSNGLKIEDIVGKSINY